MKKTLLWKVYFWVLAFLVGFAALNKFSDIPNVKLGDWTSVAEEILLVIGLYSFVFAKKIFPSKIWKVIFFTLAIGMILDLIYSYAPSDSIKQILSFRAVANESPAPIILEIIVWALLIPAFYSLYQIAFKNKYLNISQTITAEKSKEFKKISVIWIVVLTLLTFGIYIPIWFLKQREAINNLHSQEKLDKNIFIVMLVLFGAVIIVSFFQIGLLAGGNVANDIDMITTVLNLIPSLILLWQIFKVRRIFIDHFNDYLKKDFEVSGLLTFLFNIMYFQYLINKYTKG